MPRLRSVFSALFALAILVPPAHSEDEAPRILSIPEQVDRCRALSGDQRDECLVGLVLRHKDVSLCDKIPESRCATIVGSALMQNCADLTGDERLHCEIQVAQQVGSVEACDGAAARTGCITAVAAGRKDPKIIVDNIDDARDRDIAIALYATELRDPSAIDLIEDNHRHDLALVSIVSSIGVGLRQMIDPEYCRRLRGGYDGDGDEESVRSLCHAAVGFSNFVQSRRDAAETPAEDDAVVAMVKDLVGAIERGEVNLRDLAGLSGGIGATDGPDCSRIPGLWSWFINGDVTFKENGSLVQGELTGAWTCDEEGAVRISWSHGFFDTLMLSEDGSSLTGTNQTGHAISGRRIGDLP